MPTPRSIVSGTGVSHSHPPAAMDKNEGSGSVGWAVPEAKTSLYNNANAVRIIPSSHPLTADLSARAAPCLSLLEAAQSRDESSSEATVRNQRPS